MKLTARLPVPPFAGSTRICACCLKPAVSGSPGPTRTDWAATTKGFPGLPPFVRQAGSLNAAVVIAARDAGALATFPQGQRRMEAMFRELCALFLGSVPDVLYGPLALRPDLVTPFIDAAPDDLGWGWRPYVIARAIRAGLPVSVHEGRFPCPPEQQAEDDAAARIYRLRQFHDNVRGLQQALLDAGRTVAPVRPA